MMKPSLTETQITECKRLRALGRTIKEIARAVGCSEVQARHYNRGKYWRKSYIKKVTTEQAAKEALAKRRLTLYLKQKVQELPKAKATLAYEIAVAKAEMATAPQLDRGKPLEW